MASSDANNYLFDINNKQYDTLTVEKILKDSYSYIAFATNDDIINIIELFSNKETYDTNSSKAVLIDIIKKALYDNTTYNISINVIVMLINEYFL